jgi:hypothetical protein
MKTALWFFIVVGFCFGASAWASQNRVTIAKWFNVPMPHKIVERVVEVEVQPPRETFEQALERILPTFGIPRIFVEALLDKECASRSMRCVRSEAHNPRQIDAAKKYSRNADEIKLIASSWCPFQVMGYNAYRYDREWQDLLTPEGCVTIGLSVFADCWERHKGKSASDRVRLSGQCYNGSGPAAEAYGRDYLSKVQASSLDAVMKALEQ